MALFIYIYTFDFTYITTVIDFNFLLLSLEFCLLHVILVFSRLRPLLYFFGFLDGDPSSLSLNALSIKD